MSYLDFVAAADSTNIKAGGSSFMEDPLTAIGGTVTGAVVSGLGSIYNTGVDFSNKIFGTEADRIDTARVVSSIDTKWGDYYDENKDFIDTLGFIGTSFIPGGLAVKGLKLARAGESVGTFSRILGYASSRQAATLEKALAEVATEGGNIFSRIQSSKLQSMAWGAADNVLQTAVFEGAVALTMKSSPMLDKEDWSTLGWDIVKTSLLGGAIGGGIESILTNKTVKDAAKLVDTKSRQYDILTNVTKTDLSLGDKAFSIIDSILSLDKKVVDGTIPFARTKTGMLDASAVMQKAKDKAITHGMLEFEKAITTAVDNDPTVGAPLADALLKMVKKGMEQGVPDGEIRKTLGDYLFNLKKLDAIGNKAVDFTQDILYLTPKASVTDTAANLMTRTKQPGDYAYRLIGKYEDAKTGVLGQKGLGSIKEAWEAGFDAVIDSANGQVHISPTSSVFQRISATEASFSSQYFNTKYLATSDTAVPTVADIAATSQKPIANVAGVQSGNRTFKFTISGGTNPAADSVENTARHYWASQLNKIDGNAEATDFSILDAVLHDPSKAAQDLSFTIRDKGQVFYRDINDFDNFVFDQKLAKAKELMEQMGPTSDFRELAYKLNVEPAWLEKAVSTKFDRKALYEDLGWSRAPAEYGSRENIILRYDTSAMELAAQKASGLVAHQSRVSEALDRTNTAAKIVLGDLHDQLPALGASITETASAVPSGAGMFTSANANYYDRLESAVQYIGNLVGKFTQKRSEDAMAILQSPAAKLLQNEKASAEVVALTQRLRGSTDELALYQDPLTSKWSVVDLPSYKAAFEHPGQQAKFKTVIELSDEAGEFMNAHQSLHAARISQRKVLAAAQGAEVRWDPDKLYAPPVDTRRVPFFAFVRQSDGTAFGSTEVGMITARDAAELQARAAQVEKNPMLKVIYKADTEAFYKAKGDFDFQRALNSPVINSELRKQGLLGDYLPSFVPQDIVEDYLQYVQRQETGLVRDAVSTKYSQQFAELQSLSDRTRALQTSKFEGLGKLFTRNVVDPFGDYIKTALNISKRGEFTLWHQLNEFVDAVGTQASRGLEKTFLQAKDGKITWQDANRELERFGVGPRFTDDVVFQDVKSGPDRNIIKQAIQKANLILANGMLRLDFANSLLNVISTPILAGTEVAAIRRSLKNDPEMFAKFEDALKVAVPGEGGKLSVPSTTKLLYKAVQNWFGDTGKELYKRYSDLGAIKDVKSMFHEMVDDLSLTPKIVPTEWAAKVDKWVEKGASLTFNNKAEEFTRFVSADVMRQITSPLVDAGRMTTQEQNAFISIFVNRVQGNYVASQRPIMFQGTLGSAIGLFQTYQFNLLQQLYRHIENRDLKTLAVMGGMQTSIFGLNGLPFFDAINTQIVGGASINEKHRDIYSMAVQGAGKEWGDWLMYGTASAFPIFPEKMPALYTRGDLNPRNLTVVPVLPQDVPAVQAAVKVVKTVVGMGERIAAGGTLSGTLLYGLEHNGINRPLAGIAQVFAGRSTTSKGDLIAANQDFDSITTFARVMGARPMDESIGLNTLYRSKAYQAMDKERTEVLGAAIKDKLYGGKSLTSEDWIDFQGKYAAAGGNITGFTRAVQRWSKNANTSVVNEVMKHSQTPAGQRMIEVLGGNGLMDYNNPAQFDE